MPCGARRSEPLVAEEAQVVAQIPNGRVQVIRQPAAGYPERITLQIRAVGQDGVGSHAALGLQVMPKGGDIAQESRTTGGAIGRRGFHAAVESGKRAPNLPLSSSDRLSPSGSL